MNKKRVSLVGIGVSIFVFLVIGIVSMIFINPDTTDNQPSKNNVETVQEESTYPTSYVIDGVPVLVQAGGLSAGCEIYACTVTLQYLGYDVDEYEFLENYLIAKPIVYDENFQRYGPDMDSAYAGDAATIYGYGINSPAMAKSMNRYLDTTGTNQKAKALQGVSLDELCKKYVVNNIPVMVWATTNMSEPYDKAFWIVNYVDENADTQIGDVETWMQNEHCLALVGYDEAYYYFCDSVSGSMTTYERGVSQQRYEQLGSQAIVVE